MYISVKIKKGKTRHTNTNIKTKEHNKIARLKGHDTVYTLLSLMRTEQGLDCPFCNSDVYGLLRTKLRSISFKMKQLTIY